MTMFSAHETAMRMKCLGIFPELARLSAMRTLPAGMTLHSIALQQNSTMSAVLQAKTPSFPVLEAARALQQAQERRDELSASIMAGICAPRPSRPAYGPPRLVYSADRDEPDQNA